MWAFLISDLGKSHNSLATAFAACHCFSPFAWRQLVAKLFSIFLSLAFPAHLMFHTKVPCTYRAIYYLLLITSSFIFIASSEDFIVAAVVVVVVECYWRHRGRYFFCLVISPQYKMWIFSFFGNLNESHAWWKSGWRMKRDVKIEREFFASCFCVVVGEKFLTILLQPSPANSSNFVTTAHKQTILCCW